MSTSALRSGSSGVSDALTENLVLHRFPPETRQRWAPRLAAVTLAEGSVLHQLGALAAHAYFPTTAVVALHVGAVKEPGLAVAMIGRRSVLGAGMMFGLASANAYAQTLLPGRAWRLDLTAVRAEFDRDGDARQVLMECTQTLVALVAQTALCVRQHTLDQQLATRLLQLAGAVNSPWLPLTQARLAGVLGVRREGVNHALQRWQTAGSIEVKRGGIRLLQPQALRAVCCKCHAAVQQAEDWLIDGRR
jgi:CRP-like cAMP-binding protein